MNVLPRDLAGAIIASLFVAIALTAIAAGLSARPRRERLPVWFGIFCLLYGLRLGVRSSLVRLVIPASPSLFHYIDAFVTYIILVPGGLFVETLVGRGWHDVVRRTWQLALVYAALAIVNDSVRGRPYATMWLNAPVVLITLAVQVPHVIARARGGRWSIEARAVAATCAIFTLVVIYETVRPVRPEFRRRAGGDAVVHHGARLVRAGTGA